MSRKEVIKLLKLIRSTVYLGNRKFLDALEFAINYLNQPITPQWIPCSERLPEHSYGMNFLVTVKFDDDYKKVMICEWSSFHKSEDVFKAPKKLNINGFTYWVYQPVPMDRVIAWMPLPESYTERREE